MDKRDEASEAKKGKAEKKNINHEDIAELIFKGYEDEDDKRMQDNLKEHVAGLFPGE